MRNRFGLEGSAVVVAGAACVLLAYTRLDWFQDQFWFDEHGGASFADLHGVADEAPWARRNIQSVLSPEGVQI